jgi:hypothetical protein
MAIPQLLIRNELIFHLQKLQTNAINLCSPTFRGAGLLGHGGRMQLLPKISATDA